MSSFTTLPASSKSRTSESSGNTLSTYTLTARRSDRLSNLHKDYEEVRRKRSENDQPNNILLFTVINPSYPITTEVLLKICKPSGNVLRIVVFKKNGVQAMIEFDTLDEAIRAKEALNGSDIYTGCCTLKIEFAKPSKLNVFKNDSETWDFTQPLLGMGNSRPARSGPLLAESSRLQTIPPLNMHSTFNSECQLSPCACLLPSPAISFHSTPIYPNDDNFSSSPNGFEFERSYNSNPLDQFNSNPREGGRSRGSFLLAIDPMISSGSRPPEVGAVLMVYELDPKRVNPDKIFNLFCLYGNVAKIKFLKTKEGCCMVQMGDPLSAERALYNLSKTVLCNGKRLAVAISKQVYLSDVLHPYQLLDGSDSFQDYTGSRKNRFINMKMAMKNRIQPPNKILHFFNAPPNITEEQLEEVFTKAGVVAPAVINIFKTRKDDEKPVSSSSGLVEFEDLKDAVDAIMQVNHASIDSDAGKYPFMLKLCFSSSRSVNSSQRRCGDHNEEVN